MFFTEKLLQINLRIIIEHEPINRSRQREFALYQDIKARMKDRQISNDTSVPHVRGVPCVLDNDAVYIALNAQESKWLCPHCLHNLKMNGPDLICRNGCHADQVRQGLIWKRIISAFKRKFWKVRVARTYSSELFDNSFLHERK